MSSTDSITPITAGSEPSTCPSDPGAKQRLQTEQQRVYEVHSLIDLVQTQLFAIDGDEDALDISEEASTWTNALEVAKRNLNEIAERLEILGNSCPPQDG
jgi:DNA repair ATPase RecN